MAQRDVTRTIQDLTHLTWDERATSSGTAGTYLKARMGTGTRMRYYKLSRYTGTRIDGHECVNEVIASRLMELLGIEHVTYRLVHARVIVDGIEHVTWLDVSRNFRRPGERKLGLGTFFELFRQEGETPYELCCRYGWGEFIHRLMLVDYLVMNRDRHSSNIEVLADGGGAFRLAPVFDTGLSLLAPYAEDAERALAVDPLTDVRTANFVGSRSLEDNLSLVAPVSGVRELSQGDVDALLVGLEEALPQGYPEKIRDIIWKRWQRYADVRAR